MECDLKFVSVNKVLLRLPYRESVGGPEGAVAAYP
jgi:hypothetical protein